MSASWLVGIEEAELVALLLEPFDGLWQCGTQFINTLEGVVEGDNTSVACVTLYVFDHFIGGEQAAIVTSRNKCECISLSASYVSRKKVLLR